MEKEKTGVEAALFKRMMRGKEKEVAGGTQRSDGWKRRRQLHYLRE